MVNPPRAVAPPAAPAGTANVRAVTATSPQEGVSPVKIGFRPICRTTTRPTAALIATKGTRADGRVAEAKAGGGLAAAPVLTLELTDISSGAGRCTPLGPIKFE